MAKLAKREAGVSIFRDRETGRVLVIHRTLKCQHCSMHWDVKPGSGIRRGFCQNCNGPTCGKPTCEPCVHWEQRLENIEAGRDELWKPIRATVPGLIIPEGIFCAADPTEIGDPFNSPDGFNLGPAGGSERGDPLPGVRAEALDCTPAECARL